MSDICQVCSRGAPRPLVEQPPHRWVQCAGCRFAWLSPMPSMAEAHAVQDTARGDAYIAGYLRKLESKMRRSRRRARGLKRRMRGPRLLDIGSNIGCLVGAGAALGLDATGIEINPILVEEARRLYPHGRFVVGAFEEVDFPTAAFDGVYCSEVIEHVVDSNDFLARMAAVMSPGAALYLTTPALREYTARGQPASWRNFGAPDHKLYFSPANMRRMLRKHGFDDVRIAFNFSRGLKLFARRQPNPT